jgi:competence protein ComEA
MNWRDFFYFSKGERRALTVLLCLICFSWIALLFTDDKNSYENEDIGRISSTSPELASQRPKIYSNEERPAFERNSSSIRMKRKSLPKVLQNTSERNFASFNNRKYTYQPYPKVEKYPTGTIIELNTADTISLKKVPGIGSAFARRIVKYREILGGYYSVEQLREVYGMDEERYQSLRPWFRADLKYIRMLSVNQLSADSLRRHPYIDYHQARALEHLRRQKSRLTGWENLLLLEEFTDSDRARLSPYLSFE